MIPPFEVNGLPLNISYTIQVGAAPGPSLTNGRLTLDVKPNPVFAEDGSAIEEGESGLELLTIRVSQCSSYHCTVSSSCVQGTNLDSVEREQIVVTVGERVCIDRGSDTDDTNTVSIFQSHIYLTYHSRLILYYTVCVLPTRPTSWWTIRGSSYGRNTFLLHYIQSSLAIVYRSVLARTLNIM